MTKWNDLSRRLLANGRGHLHVPPRRLSRADRVRSWLTDDSGAAVGVLLALLAVVAVVVGRV